ncbi:MAG: ABC transporter substrate-binding protein, partial [Geminicoccaceae bacterium]
MRRRTLLRAAGSAMAGAVAGAAAPARAQERLTWRMVTTWPKNAPGVGINAQRLADRIGQMSDSRLSVRLYAAGELVPAFEA